MDQTDLLLDTDIGSDIDDAVALAYLLKQPCCNLLGVTTVSGEPDKRAMLASAVCRAAGRPQVPIHVGAGQPLLVEQHQPHAPQTEALTSRWSHARFGVRNSAIAFMQETIRARPGEVTLLAIGPLTNVGLLFALDPEIPGLLKRMALMGGRYLPPPAGAAAIEWNILCDPHAASIVFRSNLPEIVAVGLDVTERCRMDADSVRRRFREAGGPLELVAAMAEVWFKNSSAITFHDPLAAALIFDPALCEMARGSISVEVCEDAPGRTIFRSDAARARCAVASHVDPAAFFDHYFSVVTH